MFDPSLPPDRGFATKPRAGESRPDADFFDFALLAATVTFFVVTAITTYLLNVTLDVDWSAAGGEEVLAVHVAPGALMGGAMHSLIRWLPSRFHPRN